MRERVAGTARSKRRLRRRERHGRGPRGVLLPTSVPAWRSRSAQFDDLVLDSIARLPSTYADAVARIEFAVEDVPPADPSPWEEGEVALSRLFPADRGLPVRIVIYRRPVESRSEAYERADYVHGVVVEQVARALGVSPTELDPHHREF